MDNPQTKQTAKALMHHMQAFDRGDIDAILSGYADDAIVLTPEGPYRGRDAIRPIIEWFAQNLFTPDAQFELVREHVENDVAYIVWSAQSPGYRVRMGTDTFIVRNEKIVVQTIAATIEQVNPQDS